MNPPQITTLHYTPVLLRRAVWAFWSRSVGITLSLTLLLVTVYLVSLVRDGHTSWLVGVFGTLVVMGYVYLAALYLLRLRYEMATLRAMGSPLATLEIDSKGFTVVSGAGQATMPWRSIEAVWRYPDFWLLLFSGSHFMTLPLDNLPETMRSEMLERVREHGAKVL
jgi:hypothetical protein